MITRSILCGVTLLIGCFDPAHGQTASDTRMNDTRSRSNAFYDRNGSFAGSTIEHGNSTAGYDRNGKFDGTAIRNSDGTTSFYDRSGHFTGSRSNTTQPR
jgi:hypothetical protein